MISDCLLHQRSAPEYKESDRRCPGSDWGLTAGLSEEHIKRVYHCPLTAREEESMALLFWLADSEVVSGLTSLIPVIPKRVHHRKMAPMSSTQSHSNNGSDAFEDRLLNEKSGPITSPGIDNSKQKWGHYCLNVRATAWGVVIGI